MKNIYLGSTNNIKTLAVKNVFSDYLVHSVDVKSEVSNQPKTIEETISGAYNRAKNIKEQGIRIGLEAGLHLINNKCFLINFGALIDEDDNVYYAGGTFIPLDNKIKDMIFKENKELKDVMKEIEEITDINKKDGTVGFLTNNLVTRKDIFENICKLLRGQMERQRRIK